MITDVERWDRAHLYRFRAYPWRVVDGDTFVALPDVGFDGAAFPHIRLLDYSAPEKYATGGLDAMERIDVALHLNTAVKWPLRIESKLRETVVEGVKTFARYVATVWVVRPDGTMVDIRTILIESGGPG